MNHGGVLVLWDRRRSARVVPVLAGALLYASSAVAQVPGEETARHRFDEGVALEKKADYAAALAKFVESEQIKATLGNRYHKAYCLEMMGKLAAALAEYEFVDKRARETDKTELAEATRIRLEPLRARVPQLSLKLGPAAPNETEVTLDGTLVSPALIGGQAFRIDPGQHIITARAADHAAFTKSITAPEGTTTSIEVVLQKEAKAKPEKREPADRTDIDPSGATGQHSSTLPILTTAGAVVLGAAGTAFYVVAGNEQEVLRATCQTPPGCSEEDKSPTRTFDALALGSWIGAASLAALSVVLWTAKSNASASASAKVLARSSWLGVEGRF